MTDLGAALAHEPLGQRLQKPRVLHITEAMGGGVMSALLEYARSTPEYEHHLLYAPRHRHDTAQQLELSFASVCVTRPGPMRLAAAVRETFVSVKPNVVHLHSSWAGLVGRLLLSNKHVPILYSPHCFAFERTDTSRLSRAYTRFAERLLSSRTTLAACVGPREFDLATALGYEALLVPNEVRIDPADFAGTREPGLVLGIGRLDAQKDPLFFASVARELSASSCSARTVWIGDGDDVVRRQMAAAGVEVTGWLPRDEVLTLLARASVYCHTAAWDGHPMTVLEARALGTPVVVRSIPPMTAMGYPEGLDSPLAVAGAVSSALGSTPAAQHQENERFSTTTMSAVYLTALGSRARRPSRTAV